MRESAIFAILLLVLMITPNFMCASAIASNTSTSKTPIYTNLSSHETSAAQMPLSPDITQISPLIQDYLRAIAKLKPGDYIPPPIHVVGNGSDYYRILQALLNLNNMTPEYFDFIYKYVNVITCNENSSIQLAPKRYMSRIMHTAKLVLMKIIFQIQEMMRQLLRFLSMRLVIVENLRRSGLCLRMNVVKLNVIS